MALIRVLAIRIGRPITRVNCKRCLSWEPLVIVNALTESIQTVHAHSGIPWWALIPIATFSLRSAWTLPLAIIQRRRIQKQNRLRPLISAMNPVFRLKLAKRVQEAKTEADKARKTIEAASESDSAEAYAIMHSPASNMKYEDIILLAAKETRKRQKALFKKHNVQLYKNFLLPAFQIPLWVCMSLTMRDLSGWSTWVSSANKPLDADLYTQGLAWFRDLTLSDPIHIFPIVIGAVALCNVEWSVRSLQLLQILPRKSLRPTLSDSMANVSRMMIVFLMAASLHAPVALSLYWLSSQVFSLIQNFYMDSVFPLGYTPRNRLEPKSSASLNPINLINKPVR